MDRIRGFEPVENRKTYAPGVEILMPLRATRTSAGYDFYAPYAKEIEVGATAIFATDVKAYMQPDEFLMFVPRSSVGMKKNLMLANSVGVVDSDYYNNPDNEGNIHIALRNLSRYTIRTIEKGERVAQAIFMKYLPADNCNSDMERTGGIGSTSR